MYNIRVVARKAKLVENHASRGAWFLPGFACLRIKACGCELAFGENHAPRGAWFSPGFACLCIKACRCELAFEENHAPLGAWFLVSRPFKCAWFSH